MKPGNKGKGCELLNEITMDRVSKVRHRGTIKRAVKQKKELSEIQKAHLKKLHDAKAGQFELGHPLANKKEKDEDEPVDKKDETDEILTKKEKKLKDDLFWVLEKLGGRQKILQMAKKSDSLKVVIIKELLKVEVKELEARLRLKIAPQGGAGFYFVLAGLNDIKKVEGLGHDMKFLGNALTPDEPIDVTPYEEEKDEP